MTMKLPLILILSILISACSLNQRNLFSESSTSNDFNKNTLLTTKKQQPYLNWDRALTASILLNKDYPFSLHMNAYAALYHPDIFTLYKNDDALFALQKIKLRRRWKSDNEQQRNQTLLLRSEINLGAYNSQQQAFPIQNFTLDDREPTYHYKLTRSLSKESTFPASFYLYISNIKQLKQLKLEPELARLLTNNNIQKGHINRLPIDIELNINQVAGENGQGLGAVMTRVIFYSDENREVPLRIDSFSVVDINEEY
ncbi:DUF4852 domain-containing protein [Moritella sp. 24]|nr:DUF4852 domain-containing protein [Moritella sp. 24]